MSHHAHRMPIEETALFVDLDAALSPVGNDSPDLWPAEAYRELLERASRQLGGRLAIMSSRPLSAVDELLGASVACVAASDGSQRRTALGEVFEAGAHPQLENAVAVLEALANAQMGLRVVTRPGAVTINYDSAPQAAEAVVETVSRLADTTGLVARHEGPRSALLAVGADRAAALRTFLREAPFLGARPLLIGDAEGDGRLLAETKDMGGAAVIVGETASESADLWLPNPDAAFAFLAQGLQHGAFDIGEAPWPH